jgi:ADP-heptose:LPS heptosyltransferase
VGPRKLILENFQPPGDIVMLTAAVRDLHRLYPGRFVTDVRTSSPDLWWNNPYLTPLRDDDADVETLECHYPLVHRSNQEPVHFLHGFMEFLSAELDVRLRPTEFKGDIHLSDDERAWFSHVEAELGKSRPFWLLVSGGKRDFTVKWWDASRLQRVIDHFRGRIEFVQVGQPDDHHPALRGAIDLRGATTLRQLIRLVYHAQGAISPISLLMHLAAAVEVKPGMPKNRPCVVIAGGREPPQWFSYPHHRVLHRVGALWCCDNGGCWKSRAVALGDGEPNDAPGELCLQPVGTLPRCMDLITAEDVIRAVETYFEGGVASYISSESSKPRSLWNQKDHTTPTSPTSP